MNAIAKSTKTQLMSALRTVMLTAALFVKRPGIDFTRKKKLSFKTTVLAVLSMGGLPLNRELLRLFNFKITTPTASALVQQRDKILPEAFEFLFREFTDSLPLTKGFFGYRLLAIDGSDINIARNPKDDSTHFKNCENTPGFNLLHLNALYDLRNRLYVDYIVQPRREENGCAALVKMVQRSKVGRKVVILADRGYECYNVFEHIERKGWNYAIRVTDIHTLGMLSPLNLPDGEFDVDIRRILTRRLTKEVKENPGIYRFLASKITFDHFDSEGLCPVSFRAVRFKLKTGEYESIISNLSREEFPPEMIRKLYNMRWGIETSFRKLKHTIGLSALHARKTDSIAQEIAARLIMYNFCEMIVGSVVIAQNDRKHCYMVNFTMATDICLRFFRRRGNDPPDVESLIKKYTLPVRDNRTFPRTCKRRGFVSFVYRIA